MLTVSERHVHVRKSMVSIGLGASLRFQASMGGVGTYAPWMREGYCTENAYSKAVVIVTSYNACRIKGTVSPTFLCT